MTVKRASCALATALSLRTSCWEEEMQLQRAEENRGGMKCGDNSSLVLNFSFILSKSSFLSSKSASLRKTYQHLFEGVQDRSRGQPMISTKSSATGDEAPSKNSSSSDGEKFSSLTQRTSSNKSWGFSSSSML